MSHKELILAALRQYMGDDIYRARHAFKGCTPSEMNSQYGVSGKTRQQILDDYEEHNARVEAAIAYVKALP